MATRKRRWSMRKNEKVGSKKVAMLWKRHAGNYRS